jgi:anaerobic selenocysteine-containing dehydrogenase
MMVTENGKLLAQEPNLDHPTGGALCVKGRAAPEIVYRPERQLYPLIRTRPKDDPDPGWKRVSWEEALDKVASQIDRIRKESGPEAIAFGLTTPSGTPISDDIHWINRLAAALGTPNIAAGVEVCNWHKDYAQAFTFGRSVASPDFEKTGCVVLWGHNPSATWLNHASKTAAAVARGAKLIVVDPRNAGFASQADQWLRVRPGSDGALALGIAREMLSNGWFDEQFIKRWSNGPLLVRTDTMKFLRTDDVALPNLLPAGHLLARAASGALVPYDPGTKTYSMDVDLDLFAETNVESVTGVPIACTSAMSLYQALCEQFTPERVAELCWIPKEQVRQTARLLYEARPVSYYLWTGTGQHTNATQTDRAIAILMALTGSFDAPGGNVEFAKPKVNDVSGGNFLSPEQRGKCIEYAHSTLGPARQGFVTADSIYTAILDNKPYTLRGVRCVSR